MAESRARYEDFTPALNMADIIEAAAGSGALITLTHRALARLAEDLGGSQEEAVSWLLTLANDHGAPVALNLPATEDPDGPSTTMVLPPMNWTREQLADFVAAHEDELAASFGSIERVYDGTAA